MNARVHLASNRRYSRSTFEVLGIVQGVEWVDSDILDDVSVCWQNVGRYSSLVCVGYIVFDASTIRGVFDEVSSRFTFSKTFLLYNLLDDMILVSILAYYSGIFHIERE